MAQHIRLYMQLKSFFTKSFFTVLPTIAALAFVPQSGFAQPAIEAGLAAGPVVSPTRMVMEGRTRSGSFLVANTSTVPITYRVQFTNQRMLENGSFEPITDDLRPDERVLVSNDSRQRLVLFSPRQFTLQPNQVQIVRLQVRKPQNLATGEYRSHLVFSAIPPAGTGQRLNADDNPDGIAIQLIPIKGVSVPIIMRHGAISGNVTLSDLSVSIGANQTQELNLRMNRTGDASVYGDFEIIYTGGGQQTEVGIIKGVAVYTPNASRTLRIPLAMPEGGAVPGGPLLVRYKQRPADGGADIATATVGF